MSIDNPNASPVDLEGLSTHEYERVLELIAPFERAWKDYQTEHVLIDVTRFVPPPNDPLYRIVLLELIKIDLEYRWRHHRPAHLEDYLPRLPDLGTLDDLPVKLIHEEYIVRRRHGDRPPLESFRERFPRQFADLRQRVEAEPDPTLVRGAPPSEALIDLAPLLQGQYEIQQELGHGGMGYVYRAYDYKHKRLVALKTMRGRDALSLYRFRREFRAGADLTHRNLVSLYEMVMAGDQGFFTMELVQGCNLVEYVRHSATPAETASGPVSATPGSNGATTVGPPLTAEQLTRLRESLAQLAEGLLALHEAGRLHRDIKPSNVLITPEGRVVLLDFGIAAELDRSGLYQSTDPHVLGTVAYMAPEQAASESLSPATDWYAVGIMLFEALTGRLPFAGPPLQVLIAKRERAAPMPRDLVPEVPEDLNALTVDLLERDPRARPNSHAILERLGPRTRTSPSPVPSPTAPFVGRRRHVDALRAAFHEVQSGTAVTLYVHGRSGAGKTALMQRFLDGLEERGEALILEGHCYEQESVPYKALDGVLDALSRVLRRQTTQEARAWLPRNVWALARLFPVLQMVPAVAAARRTTITDPQEQRRRAVAALRDLLGRLSEQQPLVIAIDDLHWGDTESAALLRELTQPPDAPVMLLLGCYRDEDAVTSPCLQALLRPNDVGQAALWRELPVEALTAEEGKELALALLNQTRTLVNGQAEVIARESSGNPFFVHELVQHFRALPETAASQVPADDLRLSQVLWARIGRLPDPSRRLLEVVAVAGRPLRLQEASRAAGWEEDEPGTVAALRSGRLLRTTGTVETPLIETYHDRIRETVRSHLSPETRRQHHDRLAGVLEEAGSTDFEALAVHYREAGRNQRAADFSVRAADKATQALAFDHAVRLYRQALELGGHFDLEQRRQLGVRVAESLANAGRVTEAARGFLMLCTPASADLPVDTGGADRRQQHEMQCRAALLLLISGQVTEGLALLEEAVRAAGLRMPSGTWLDLIEVKIRRDLLWLGHFRAQEGDPARVSPELLAQIDVCFAAAVGLFVVDPLRATVFQTRGLWLALDAGHPYQLARALIIEVAYRSIEGKRSRGLREELCRRAEQLIPRVPDADDRNYFQALVQAARALAAAGEGSWAEARQQTEVAEKLLREAGSALLGWEFILLNPFALLSLLYLGDVPEINRRLPRLLKEAQEREDLASFTMLCLMIRTTVRLAADEPERVRAELDEVLSHWSPQGFHHQHLFHLCGRCQIDLYEGHPEAAWQRLRQSWPSVKRSLLLEVQQLRIITTHLRGSCAVALAVRVPRPGPLWAQARHDVRDLRGEQADWATALGLLLEAAVLCGQNDRLGAIDRLQEGVSRCRETQMCLYEAAALRRLGQLRGGNSGAEEVARGERLMAERGLKDIRRMTALLAPGFPEH